MREDKDSKIFSYMQLGNVSFIEDQYQKYLKDPKSIEASWRYFFEGVAFGEFSKKEMGDIDAVRIEHLIEAYREFGHLEADTNPIKKNPPAAELYLQQLGFEEKDLQQSFPTNGLMQETKAPLAKIIATLKKIYCGSIGFEYRHTENPPLESWIQKEIEPHLSQPNFSFEEKKEILHLLNKAEVFEIFLHTKYVGQKRFSLEGGETLIAVLSFLIEEGAERRMDEFVIGMAHRGRLNVLTNILQKSYSMVFSEFEDYLDPNLTEGAGDVKYHKGYSSNITTRKNKQVHLSLAPNPSHLESVDAVVQGKVRAKQEERDPEKKQVVPLLIHGDASLAGQGIVYETLQFSRLEGYGNGGTLHIVINNQIGFTTLPEEYSSMRYCSDIAHAFKFPVFHVNVEDPEGCIYAALLALQIRALFHLDVFIVMNGYRKYGHNEGDEPAFTQPEEYKIIRSKKSIREIYRDKLIQEGILEKQMALGLEEEFKKTLHFELEEMKIKKEQVVEEAFGGVWKEYRKAAKNEIFEPCATAVNLELLQEISKKVTSSAEPLELHSKLLRVIEQRKKMGQKEIPLDWAMAETLAFGTLLWEGFPVRLTGQDSQRGTFSQRHAVWVDQNSSKKYFPLSHLKQEQGAFYTYNSPLSEFGSLGFEFGYSLSSPKTLVLWEAQFGDFANGAQVIFDQYMAPSAKKWNRYSGLVVLLPHGYEGQGSEHSSARIERFLQLAGESNMQIVYPTTPAQYFHVLRRQMKRRMRLPLILFTPKGLLRHPRCVSSLDDLSQRTFQEILDDEECKEPRRLLLCSGRIYYDLLEEREKRKEENVAIVRLEQLYPLHHEKLVSLLEKYKEVKNVYWVQEEPQNMGAYSYLYPILHKLLDGRNLIYVGRRKSAVTAPNSHRLHEKEQEEIMNMAFD